MLARDVVDALTARGHEVHVLTAHGRDLPKQPTIHSVLNYSLDDKDAIFMGGKVPSLAQLYRRHVFDRETYRRSAAELRRLHPDLIVADNQYMASTAGLIAARGAGCPVVAQVADKWLRYLLWDLGMLLRPGKGWQRQALRMYVRRIQPVLRARAMPDQMIAISDFIKRNYIEEGFPAERIHALYLGVDTHLYQPRQHPHSGKDSLEIVFAGQLWEGKGPQVLVAALGLLRSQQPDLDLRLRIIGTGAAAFQNYLREQIGSHGLLDRVSLEGFVALPRLAESLRQCDIFVFPSTWDEPFSITLVAAMASGAAVVATRTGGTPEALLDGVEGLLIPPNDADSLAGAVLRLARDPELRDRLSQAAVARAVTQWRFDAYVDRLERQYQEIVSTHA
jgi:glycosyltransferase involved in cell wall biosynthesis